MPHRNPPVLARPARTAERITVSFLTCCRRSNRPPCRPEQAERACVMLRDVERSVTRLIDEHGDEGAVAWAEKRARELFEAGDQDGGVAMLWFSRVIRRRAQVGHGTS